MNRYSRPAGPWRPVGVPYYLDAQRERFGFDVRITEHPRVKDNRQLSKIGGLTVQVCTNYFGSPRRGEGREFPDWQLDAVRATLAHCEDEIARTHAIAAASVAMTDEAYGAFGLEPPTRNFSVVVASEAPAESVEVAALRVEVERLKAENASLAEQLTRPADDRPLHHHKSTTPPPTAGRPAKA